jgi:hypothetical protein
MNIVKLGIQEDIEEESKEKSSDSSSQTKPVSEEERKKAKLQALERIMKLMKQLR